MANKGRLLSQALEDFYNSASEETRLEQGMGAFEFERVKALIEEYLPKKPSQILDVGGGTGKYASWLAQKQHTVHLVEPVDKHLETARRRSKKLKHTFAVHKGIAQHLDFPDNFADVVLLHGPLYHLQEEKERLKALREAKRVLKPNGIVLGFAINHTASTLVGLLSGMLHQKSFFEMCKEELTTGIHNPPKEFPMLLAESYYHKPDILKNEFIKADLTPLNFHAVEGMAWLDNEFFASLGQPDKKETLLELLSLTDKEESLLAFSPHILLAGSA